MSAFVSRVTNFFKPHTLTPDERWRRESKYCVTINRISNVAAQIFKGLLVGMGVASLVVPSIVIGLGTSGLGLAIGAAAVAVAGVALSIFVFIQLEKMRKSLDFTDYSDKSVVSKDIDRLTRLPLDVLSEPRTSPIYRIDNLKRYGVIGGKSAERMQALCTNYKEARQLMQKYAYEYPHVAIAGNSAGPGVELYKKAKERLEKSRLDWAQFQTDVVKDLPKFA